MLQSETGAPLPGTHKTNQSADLGHGEGKYSVITGRQAKRMGI